MGFVAISDFRDESSVSLQLIHIDQDKTDKGFSVIPGISCVKNSLHEMKVNCELLDSFKSHSIARKFDPSK
jgi:hypothetical protein